MRRRVIDPDDGGVVTGLIVEDVRLGSDIARQIAMPVNMVRCDVEENGHITAQTFDEVQLIG